MVYTFFLIITLASPQSTTITQIGPFAGRDACMAAAATWLTNTDDLRKAGGYSASTACVNDGAT